MKVIVLQPTIIGGVDYQPSMGGEYTNIPDHVAQHMVAIGNAKPYETKEVQVTEKKTLSASQPAQVLQKKTAPKRRARKPKSSQ